VKLLGWSLKGLWWAAVIAVPLTGAWIASSMAAYWNGPTWAVALAGALLFPVLPITWELLGALRRKRRGKSGPRVLTFGDRLILRTLALNLLFLGPLLYRFPDTAFTAISVRGDWMLDGREGPEVEQAREGLFVAADGLEWLYSASHENPYATMAEGDEPPTPAPAPTVTPIPTVTLDEGLDEDSEPGVAAPVAERRVWPQPGSLHPRVATVPDDAATLEAVATHLVDGVDDPYERVKVLHDFVADHVAYDYESLKPGQRAPQDARTVFDTGLGVCAGYSNLLKAMGDAVGEEIVYVIGDSRDDGGDIAGGGHAWNAARIDDQWHLIDVTWSAGSEGPNGKFRKDYDTDWLFTPPQVFVRTHLPDNESWQLLEAPVSRGDFVRAPMMRPAFYAAGLSLTEPTRSQITVDGVAKLTLENPGRTDLRVSYEPLEGGDRERCTVKGIDTQEVTCRFEDEGTYLVYFFLPKAGGGDTYWSGGQIEVNNTAG